MSDSDDFLSGSQSALDWTIKLNDPIIQKILKDRTVDSDDHITQEDELERQKKMYMWLRNSKKYRKFQVEDANQKEKDSNLLDMRSIQEACDSIKDLNNASSKKPEEKAKRKVSFSKSNHHIIPPQAHSDLFDSDEYKT